MSNNEFVEHMFNESYKIKQMIPKGRIAYEFVELSVKERS